APAVDALVLRAERVRERRVRLADEDVLHGARGGLLVVALVLEVVRRDRRLRDGDVLRQLVEEALRDEVRLDLVANLLLGQLVLLELLLVALLAPAEVLLLDRLEPRRDVLVGDRDAELRGLVLLLGLLDWR